ncbi:MAG: GNAT family N-acetyltransferase [candidate division KSB1 bacterium]|nr:GNAT family N-acetyltransferase [candidate division KSB1 bacterium]
MGNNNNGTAQIGLIAVHPQAQGKGIASYLIQVATNYAFDRGFETLEVATQYNNKPAMKLYQKSGFKIKSKQYIYHIWNK